jgi:TATA-binding protein-associated factor Taf7
LWFSGCHDEDLDKGAADAIALVEVDHGTKEAKKEATAYEVRRKENPKTPINCCRCSVEEAEAVGVV